MSTPSPATPRQRAVETYCAAYSRGDHNAALSIFTDDVRWIVSGAFDVRGKDAYRAQMTPPHAKGNPTIQILRLFEDGDSVICEGAVRHDLAAGGTLSIVFLDVFQFRGDLVCEKRSYVMQA